MDLTVMNYVVSVADSGNFSQAAEVCHVGQPALSQQIARLEKELGVRLFFRNPRGAVLTEAGTEFVRRAREILKSADELSEQMSFFAGLHRGSLTLGIITSLQCIEFGSMLSAFVHSYPDITFSIRQFGTYQLAEMLTDRKIDLAFMNRPLQGVPSQLAFEKLGEDRYDLAVPYDHPLAARAVRAKSSPGGTGPEHLAEVSMQELKDERFIFHQPWQVASELVLKACRDAGFEPNIVCRSGEPGTSLYMVQGGMGVALFPEEEFMGRQLDGICRLHIKEDIIKEVGVAWRKDSESPLITEAVRFAKEWSRLI
ncbi:MAG: LysR family transcriptional regulator [Stomatobaculum sp.]|nr:LysR family transcriptional regulator [Stomatobaculum sp.]